MFAVGCECEHVGQRAGLLTDVHHAGHHDGKDPRRPQARRDRFALLDPIMHGAHNLPEHHVPGQTSLMTKWNESHREHVGYRGDTTNRKVATHWDYQDEVKNDTGVSRDTPSWNNGQQFPVKPW